MCNEDFYAEFGNDVMTFNGLDYSVNNHSPGERYMATGKLDSLAYPTFAALVAACRGTRLPARLPDVWELLGDRQPDSHVASAVSAITQKDRQRRFH